MVSTMAAPAHHNTENLFKIDCTIMNQCWCKFVDVMIFSMNTLECFSCPNFQHVDVHCLDQCVMTVNRWQDDVCASQEFRARNVQSALVIRRSWDLLGVFLVSFTFVHFVVHTHCHLNYFLWQIYKNFTLREWIAENNNAWTYEVLSFSELCV